MIQLSKELVARGHEVEVYCLPFMLKDGGKLDPEKELGDIPYHEGYFHNVKADVTYIMYSPLNWLNFNTRKPRIAGFHSHCYWQPINRKYGILPNISNIVHRLIGDIELERFNAIHVLTDFYKINHDNVFYIPNFVDGSQFYKCNEKYPEFTVGYASRKVWQKGYDIYQKIKKMNLEGIKFIETTGKIPENKLPEWYSKVHVLLNTSRVDTFGLAIVEPLFCGTPVIASDIDTHRALDVGLRFAVTPLGYIQEINKLKTEFDLGNYRRIEESCRLLSSRFEKKKVMDELEKMLESVSNEK